MAIEKLQIKEYEEESSHSLEREMDAFSCVGMVADMIGVKKNT